MSWSPNFHETNRVASEVPVYTDELSLNRPLQYRNNLAATDVYQGDFAPGMVPYPRETDSANYFHRRDTLLQPVMTDRGRIRRTTVSPLPMHLQRANN